MDTGCRLKDLPEVMDNWVGWGERVREICAVSNIDDDDDDNS